MIRLIDVSKTIGYRSILQHIDCEISTGDFVGIYGPNGAGKTTLLRILAALTPFTRGSIQIDSYALPSEAMRIRHLIAFLGHQSVLYPELNARENLCFYCGIYQITCTAPQMDEILASAGLYDCQFEAVRTYSLGMQQRLQLAILFAKDADYLLLDEPYHGLDEQGSTYLDSTLRQSQQDGKTILLVSHNHAQLMSLCNQTYQMKAGVLTPGNLHQKEGQD